MNADFAINGKQLQTERLILRAFKQSDLNDFFEYASVEGVGEMAGWKHHASKEETQKILDNFIIHDKTFAICLKENDKVIGSLGVEMYGMEDRLTEFDGYRGRELGFVLSKDYWGHAFMPEAVRTVMDYLFCEKDLDFLICGYYDFNEQSKQVQEKCGFKPYRKLLMDTRMGTKEPGTLNLATNPNKKITFKFSHPETLIYENTMLLEFSAMNKENMYRMVHEVYPEASYEIARDKHPEIKKIEELQEAINTEELYFVEFLEKFMSKTHSKYYVLEVNDKWVSALRLTKIEDFYYMEALETTPKHRRKGYAAQLIKSVVVLLETNGEVVIRSNVNKTNVASLATHKKCGFEIERTVATNCITGKVNEKSYGMIYKKM